MEMKSCKNRSHSWTNSLRAKRIVFSYSGVQSSSYLMLIPLVLCKFKRAHCDHPDPVVLGPSGAGRICILVRVSGEAAGDTGRTKGRFRRICETHCISCLCPGISCLTGGGRGAGCSLPGSLPGGGGWWQSLGLLVVWVPLAHPGRSRTPL